MNLLRRLGERCEAAAARRGTLFFALAALWLALEYLALGPASYVEIHDSGDHAVPWYLQAAASVRRDGVSYWMPSMACGVDRLAIDLSHIHWSELLFVALPGWLAYGLIAFLHYFLAGCFAYRLARDDLGLSAAAGVYAGLAVSLRLDFTLSYQGGYALFPLAAWCLGRLPERRGLLAAALLGAGYSFFSSFARTSLFCIPLALAWVALVRRGASAAFLGRFCVFCACATAAHLPGAWAMLLNAPLSARAGWTLDTFSGGGGLREALGATVGGLLSYKLSLLLAVCGLAASRLRHRPLVVLAAITLLCAGSGLLDWIKAAAGPDLGFLKGFQIGRFASLTWFMIAMTAGQALDLLPRRAQALAVSAAFLFLASLRVKAQHAAEWYFQGSYQANYASPVLRELARKGGDEPFRVATLPHGMHPAYANAYGLETTDGYLNIYPRTFQRFWAGVLDPLLARSETYRQRFLGWGNRIYLFIDEVESMPEGVPLERFYRLNLLSLANTKYLISRHPLLDPGLSPLVSQRPWYSMSRKERALLRLKENLLGKRYFFIYENKACLPRLFFARRARFARDAGELARNLAGADPASLRETVHLDESQRRLVGPLGFSRASLRLVRYSPDRIEADFDLDGPGFLVVSNSLSPFWRCSVNGVPRPILPAYGAFWGVYVEKGRGQVAFGYDPPYRGF